jgi:hypothetical protein
MAVVSAAFPVPRTLPLAMWLAGGAVFFAVVQYIFVITSQMSQGEVILTQADVDVLQGGGLLRYAKDLYSVFLAALSVLCLGPLTSNPVIGRLFVPYLIWLSALLALGGVPLFLVSDPAFYALAGLRWLLLLHAGVCLFAFTLRYPLRNRQQALFADILIAICFVDIVLIWLQSASLYDLQIGAGSARVLGVFTQAGVAGTFSIFVGMVGWAMRDINSLRRLALLVSAVLISVAAGSRFGMICIALLFYSSFDDLLKARKGYFRLIGRVVLVIVTCALALPAYRIMSELVDRGDLLDVQLEEGGRIANFVMGWQTIFNANLFSMLFGEGLGVGTNNVINFLRENGASTDGLMFNIQTDNSLLMIALQFGIVGSLLFWIPLVLFWRKVLVLIPKLKGVEFVFGFIVLVSIISTSIFEQYFLMIGIPFAIALRAQDTNLDPMIRESPRTVRS